MAAKADGKSAWVTSKLEFSKYPDYMKQFPFAHTITMTYRLANGAMEVHTRLDNQSAEPMPVAIGFHPYFALTDSVRKDWTLSATLKKHWLLTDTKVPTGQTERTTRPLVLRRSSIRSGGANWMKSISPVFSALACVVGSVRFSHSTRSTCTRLPPAIPDAGSGRGT